jgi:hypothetical protein
VLVVHNLSDSFGSSGAMSFQATSFDTIFSDASITPGGGSGSWSVSLPPRATGIWKVK